jgi:ribosome-associated protein
MISIPPSIEIPEDELEITYARSGGPGGQNVNKVNSKAVLRWSVVTSPSLPEDVRARFIEKYQSRLTTDGELILTSQRHRDQASNTSDCIEKLRQMLEIAARKPTVRRPTRPSLGSKIRRVDEKRENSRKKHQRRSSYSVDD